MWTNLQTAWWLFDGGVLKLQPNLYYFIVRGDNAYLSLWGTNISISKMTGLDLFSVAPYIGILIAIFVPLVLYSIVNLISKRTTVALATALMTSFVWDTFYWQSVSLANALGMLGMLFSMLFWIRYLKKDDISIFWPIIISIAGILSYPLTGIFVAVVALFSVLVKRFGIRAASITIILLSSLALPLYTQFIQIIYPIC
jgi:hypothetical protein